MTTFTTSAPHAGVDRTTGAGHLTAALQSAKRTVLQFFRTPQLLMLGTIQGALFLFMFRYIFGGAIHPGDRLAYVDFLVPGFLVTGILWLGMSAASGVAEDAASGVHDRLRSLPIPRSSVMLGRSFADAALTLWGLLITGVLAFIVGFRLHADVAAVALALVLLLFAVYSFTWVFITIGLTSGSPQAAQGTTTLVIVPLAFMSAAYVSAETLPGWMEPVADNQPFTVVTNALRSLALGGADAVGLGHSTSYWVAVSLVWCAGILGSSARSQCRASPVSARSEVSMNVDGNLDMTMMYAFHDALRRDLEPVALMTARSEGWSVFERFLRAHHAAEDDALWPVLRDALVGRTDDLALLDAMEAEHAALGPRLEAVDHALDHGESAPAARADLAVRLHEHLSHEEQAALPVIDDTLNAEQWMQFADASAARIGSDMPTFLPWLLDGAGAEPTDAILGHLPEPARRDYRNEWQPAYAAKNWWSPTSSDSINQV
jgi:ABC-2 type transport system permease protein